MPRTAREHLITFICVFFIFLYFGTFALITSNPPPPDSDSMRLNIIYFVLLGILGLLMFCCTFTHLCGFNSELINKRLNKIDEKNKISSLKCSICGHQNTLTSQFCVNCGNPLKT